MKRVTDWIQLVSSEVLFELDDMDGDDDVALNQEFKYLRNNKVYQPMDIHIPYMKRSPNNWEDIDFHHIVNEQTNGNPDLLQACSPSIDHITIAWATKESSSTLNRYGFDEANGMLIPEGVPQSSVHYDPVLPQDSQSGKFDAYALSLHRDAFPAVISIGGLRRYHAVGELHRKGGHAAITADYVAASWYRDGALGRINGPSQVLIEGYQEFYNRGKFCGYRFKAISEIWDKPLDGEPEFTTHPLSNRYFGDPQDEMMCMAELAS